MILCRNVVLYILTHCRVHRGRPNSFLLLTFWLQIRVGKSFKHVWHLGMLWLIQEFYRFYKGAAHAENLVAQLTNTGYANVAHWHRPACPRIVKADGHVSITVSEFQSDKDTICIENDQSLTVTQALSLHREADLKIATGVGSVLLLASWSATIYKYGVKHTKFPSPLLLSHHHHPFLRQVLSLLTLARSPGQPLSTSTTVLPSPVAHDVYIYHHSSLLDTIILIHPGCQRSITTTISPTTPH